MPIDYDSLEYGSGGTGLTPTQMLILKGASIDQVIKSATGQANIPSVTGFMKKKRRRMKKAKTRAKTKTKKKRGGTWRGKKVYIAKNGRRYVKNAKGQARFIK
jgi:hypothetical protein